MKIAFFGSPEFAVPTLKKIKENHNIVLVVTQPDKPAKRGLTLTPTPIKTLATSMGLSFTDKLPSKAELMALNIDKIVVVAYGRMIPAEIFENWECINLHPSLLPKYRGASPMQTALLNGDTETGISTMLISQEMDAGDILLQEKIVIDINLTIQELHDKCANQGAELIIKTLTQDIQKVRRKQDASKATHCKKISKDMSEINPSEDIHKIHNKVRAIGGYILQDGKRIKIIKTRIENNKLIIETVQPEGKPPMSYADFKRGYKFIHILKNVDE